FVLARGRQQLAVRADGDSEDLVGMRQCGYRRIERAVKSAEKAVQGLDRLLLFGRRRLQAARQPEHAGAPISLAAQAQTSIHRQAGGLMLEALAVVIYLADALFGLHL